MLRSSDERTTPHPRSPCTRAINKIKDLTNRTLSKTRNCTRAIPLLLATLIALPANAETLKIFAAASLTDALDAALVPCTANSDFNAIGIYAGSGTIARQIEQGAPADIYISANPEWMDWLAKRERIVAETRVDLLGNELVLVSMSEPDGEPDTNWVDRLSANESAERIAVADMQSVPAGIYTRQALNSANLLQNSDFAARLVQASNVREAFTWVVRDEVSLGFVYRSDATGRDIGAIFPVEETRHDPIRYPAAVIADNDSPNARRLLTCLQGEEASEIFKRYGFTVFER